VCVCVFVRACVRACVIKKEMDKDRHRRRSEEKKS